MSYLLQNKNNLISKVEALENRIVCTEIYDRDLYTRVCSIGNLLNRQLLSCKNFLEDANLLKCRRYIAFNLDEVMKFTKLISLFDCLWLNDTLNPTTWDDVNPYKNISSKRAHFLNEITGESDTFFEITISHLILRLGNYLFLVKKWPIAKMQYPKRFYMENFTYRLAKHIGIMTCVGYKFYESENNRYSVCTLFTNDKHGSVDVKTIGFNSMLEFYKYVSSNKLCNSIRVTQDALLLDALSSNNDRINNFRVLLDNDTFTFEGAAPIFDLDFGYDALLDYFDVPEMSFEDVYSSISKLPAYNSLITNAQFALRDNADMYKHIKSVGKINILPTGIQYVNVRHWEMLNYIVNRNLKEVLS